MKICETTKRNVFFSFAKTTRNTLFRIQRNDRNSAKQWPVLYSFVFRKINKKIRNCQPYTTTRYITWRKKKWGKHLLKHFSRRPKYVQYMLRERFFIVQYTYICTVQSVVYYFDSVLFRVFVFLLLDSYFVSKIFKSILDLTNFFSF